MKQLISLISTEGKSPEQLGQELYQNYLKYQAVSQKQPAPPSPESEPTPPVTKQK